LIAAREAIAIGVVILTIAGFGAYWLFDLQSEVPDHDLYVASNTCSSCHPREHQSWYQTYHRTMTQEAVPANLAAPVEDGLVVTAAGRPVEFHVNENDISVTLPFLDGLKQTLPVRYIVGSHRMQQFVVDAGEQRYRIPVFYSIQDEAWMPISDAFFHFRDESLEGFLEGYGLWDGNCIFCHNTRPSPGMNYPEWEFEPTVAEHGIACEECHGNGEIHETKNHNPLRRYLTHWRGEGDSSMFHPKRADQQRATEACGQCHGQRVPNPRDRIVELMTGGDPFRPGDNLADFYTPINAETELVESIPLRFWPDGSPRLSAYEYQGLTQSRCYLDSGLTCASCHSGHEGEPEGLISDAMRGDAACEGCHAEVETQEHAGHTPEQARCRSCHMPEVVYGVMSIHPSHLIRNPDPGRTLREGMPNACNLCHLEQSVNWAANAMETLFGKTAAHGDAQFDSPELLRGFAQGDAVYRVVLLEMMARQGLRHETIESHAKMDRFGVVRRFADRLDGTNVINFDPAEEDSFEALRASAPPAQPFEFGE
jgi:predicted CXXCH cytochrome family protein